MEGGLGGSGRLQVMGTAWRGVHGECMSITERKDG